MITWRANPTNDGYIVIAEEGEHGTPSFWGHCCMMTQEQVEDDWLPDIIAAIERRYHQRHHLRRLAGFREGETVVGYRGPWPAP